MRFGVSKLFLHPYELIILLPETEYKFLMDVQWNLVKKIVIICFHLVENWLITIRSHVSRVDKLLTF